MIYEDICSNTALFNSSMDDIVLSYTVEVLSEVHNDDSSFDVDQFCEMVSAYVPEFAEVDRLLINTNLCIR